MADLRAIGGIEYRRGTYMRKWDYDYENQKTGGRAIHLVRDCAAGQTVLIPSDTEIVTQDATIMVKNLSTTNHVAIGEQATAASEIKVLPGRFAVWTSGTATADLDVFAVGGTVKLEIIVVEA